MIKIELREDQATALADALEDFVWMEDVLDRLDLNYPVLSEILEDLLNKGARLSD